VSLDPLKTQLKNVHAFAVTPFRMDNLTEIDLDGLERNLTFLVENGVKVINVGGGTGEVEGLTGPELEVLARLALQTVGDRALILPTLPGNFGQAMGLARRYEELGAQALLGMAPFTRNLVPPHLEGVYNHYRAISEVTRLPLIPYNTQGWAPEFLARLAEIDSIVAIKDPCLVPHNLFRAIQLLGDRFVWIGNKRHDPGVLHLRYQMGIEGFTAGNVNFAPRLELGLHEAALKEDWQTMVDLQKKLAPLENLRTAYGDTLVKAGMDIVGLTGGKVRPPRIDLPQDKREELKGILKELGIEIARG
jgi:dihydrodipicolinate synthase/N-acetylneuraminate lyase